MRTLAIAISASLCGCVAGGGPLFAYTSRGWTAGAEVGGGFAFGEVNLAIESEQTDLHVDAAWSPGITGATGEPGASIAGRLGVGLGFTSEHTNGVFVAGAGPAHIVRRRCDGRASIGNPSIVAGIELQVRYSHGWQLVFAPRIDARGCFYERT